MKIIVCNVQAISKCLGHVYDIIMYIRGWFGRFRARTRNFFFHNYQHLFLDVASLNLSPAMFQGRYASLIERFVEVLKISIYNADYLTIV